MTHRTELIICLFDGANKAEEVEKTIEELDKRLDSVKLGNIAVVQKNDDGQIAFKETRDRHGNIGQIAGTVVGGVTDVVFSFMGSLGPATGPVAGYETESAVNRWVGDAGFSDSDLYEVGERLDAGHSALITLVSPEEEPIVEEQLHRLGGTILKQSVPPEALAELTSEDA